MILCECLNADLKDHDKKFNNPGETIDKSVEEICNSQVKYRTVAFLVSMITYVYNRWISEGKPVNCGEIQVRMENVKFDKMTVQKGRDTLVKLFGDDLFLFPIFIDECSFTVETRIDEAPYFMLLRGIIRSILCNPIFMGTNAEAANFLGVAPKMQSRTAIGIPWCLVWHQLPGLPKAYVNKEKTELETTLVSWRQTAPRTFLSPAFVDFFFANIVFERPLFYHLGKEVILECVNSMKNFSSDLDFFKYLVHEILTRFRLSKHQFDNFNNGQMSYMASYCWSDLKSVVVNDEVTHSDMYIHSHMGYLSLKADDQKKPYYTVLTVYSDAGVYYRTFLNDLCRSFFIRTVFKDMKSSPLTGLICTGIENDGESVLALSKTGDSYVRVSVIKAIGFSILASPPTQIALYNTNTCGFSFELMLLCSSILSSHAEGFGGCSLFTFIDHLCRELDINASYSKALPRVNYDEAKKFKETFENFRVPFLSPSTTDGWNCDFVNSLKTILPLEKIDLGISYPSIKIGASGDFFITRWDETSSSSAPAPPIIVGQCKLRSQKLGKTIFEKEIIPSFSIEDFKNCKLFIVVGRGVADMQKYFAQGFCIWKLFRSSAENLFLTVINKNQDENAEKHIITIGLDQFNDSFQSPISYPGPVAKSDRQSKRPKEPVDEISATKKALKKMRKHNPVL